MNPVRHVAERRKTASFEHSLIIDVSAIFAAAHRLAVSGSCGGMTRESDGTEDRSWDGTTAAAGAEVQLLGRDPVVDPAPVAFFGRALFVGA